MREIPAYCDNCKAWFPSGIEHRGQGTAFIDIGSVCPRCSQDGRIMNGTFAFIDGSLEIIQAAAFTRKELKKLNRIFQEAVDGNVSAEQIREIVEKEVPKASRIVRYLTDNANLRTDLPILLSVIAILIQIYAMATQQNSKQIADDVYKKMENSPSITKPSAGGVNSPCWCGSGKKRKKCHGSKAPPISPRNANKKPK